VRFRILATALVAFGGWFSVAFGLPCWNTVTPQNVVGFDFEISSVVAGPSPSGVFTYTYTLYRMDNGFAKYKGVSHVSFWFPCALDAQRGILGGPSGITMTCSEGSCPVVELGGRFGMSEPILDPSCQKFWGFKLDACGAEGGYFLLPHIDEVSYPSDWMDPFCTITFQSSSKPQMGKWLIKGGVKDGDTGKSQVYDAGEVWVPTCLGTAVPAGDPTWGRIKTLYR
jgi:hypothetical protein